MGLQAVFSERGWKIPHYVDIDGDLSGEALLRHIAIDDALVESLIVNRSAIAVEDAIIHPGDRVALVPPGVPGPHRLLLGIHGQEKPKEPFGLSFAKKDGDKPGDKDDG